MAASTRFSAVLGLALAGLLGCTTDDVSVRRSGVVVAPGDRPPILEPPDGGAVEAIATAAQSAFPRELAYVDAGRDAECHDACPARCGEDEICCWSTGFCVPLDCWECCSDSDDGRTIGHSAAEPP